jgi:GPW/gp25 family protein
MDFELTAGEIVDVDFAPQNVQMEILQNCSTILSTSKFSVPLDRDFGVDANYVDAPLLSAKAKAESEIFAALKKYEPRVTVKQITWRSNAEGVLRAKVKVVINET